MSRSIHTTRRKLDDRARRALEQGTGLKDVESAMRKSMEALQRKRRIKRRVLAERKRAPIPAAGSSVSALPIKVLDTSRFVHHAASAEDIRCVLEALPPAATQGIARIQLSLGKEYMKERCDDDEPERDPFTSRISHEVFPGVFAGKILGSYCYERGLVFVYAHVYDAAHLPMPRSLCEVYLRLHALQTLVHEIAHHHDTVNRVGRGRWLADRRENVESYAEKMEYQWTREVVIPYLERAYAKDARDLRKWVAHRGGILLPLEFFAGDSRQTGRNGTERFVFSTSGGFESWVAELPECRTLTEGRLAFAWQLHVSDAYPECLAVLDRILASEPNHVATLACKADTLVHLKRLDEAHATADAALRMDGRNPDAWQARGEVFACRKDWNGLLANSDAWERAGKPPTVAQRKIHLHRAIAHCALGNESDMEASLKAHFAACRFRSDEIATRRKLLTRRAVHRRAGKPVPPESKVKAE